MADEKKVGEGIAVGHAIGFAKPEKGPYRFFVGGIELSAWSTLKDEDGDSVENKPLTAIKEAVKDGNKPVKVKYESFEREFKERKFIDNRPVKVTTEGLDEDEITKGDKASEEAKAKAVQFRGKGGKQWQPKDEAPVASRWATSTALELAGEGVDVTQASVKKSVAKTAKALIEIASEVELHAKDLWAKRGKDKAAKAEEPEVAQEIKDNF